MMSLYAMIAAAVGVLGSVIVAYFAGGRSVKYKRDAQDAKASLDAEINRRKLDDEIDQDTNLASRARRIGLRGPGTK